MWPGATCWPAIVKAAGVTADSPLEQGKVRTITNKCADSPTAAATRMRIERPKKMSASVTWSRKPKLPLPSPTNSAPMMKTRLAPTVFMYWYENKGGSDVEAEVRRSPSRTSA